LALPCSFGSWSTELLHYGGNGKGARGCHDGAAEHAMIGHLNASLANLISKLILLSNTPR
jgi:hypothetical protein